MKVVGLTGGIGSGKTTVALMFEELGVPIYIADKEAKLLTNRSKIIKRKIIQLLGPNSYTNDGINRSFVAEKIFNDPKLLKAINNIIHPKVAQHFARWLKKQDATYCIKEAAILFESGSYKDCDKIIVVTAPMDIRIQRVLKRDHSTEKEIRNRMANQWSDEKKIELSDFVIENTHIDSTKDRVAELHRILSNT